MFGKDMSVSFSSVLSQVVRLFDVVLTLVAGLLAYYWRFGDFGITNIYVVALIFAAFAVGTVFPLTGMYRSWRGQRLINVATSLLAAWGVTILLLLVVAVLTKTNTLFSRQWFGYWTILTWLILLFFRLALYRLLRLMRERQWNQKRLLLIGCGPLGADVARRIDADAGLGLSIAGFIAAELESERDSSLPCYNVFGHLNEIASLEKLVHDERIDEVWLALPLKDEERVQMVLHALRHSTVTIRYVPDIFGFRLLNHSVSEIAGLPVMDLNMSPMVGLNRLIKAAEDRVLALLILILISPLLLLIALAVKFSSPGPVLFKQKRHGWDGKPITVYKFRSMKVHVEDDGKVTQAKKDDPRVTPIGAFLRRTSLDELPQFFNVLQGRMSIVGPRPHAVEHNDQYKDQIDAYMLRHKVKPGITGWAQVSGWRGETDTLEKMQKRVEYDLYYIEHWSLWFDIKIILMTIVKGFVHKRAY